MGKSLQDAKQGDLSRREFWALLSEAERDGIRALEEAFGPLALEAAWRHGTGTDKEKRICQDSE